MKVEEENKIRLGDNISVKIGEAVKDNAATIIPNRGANSINTKMLMSRHMIDENDNDNNSLSAPPSMITNNAAVCSNINNNRNIDMHMNTNIYESMAAASAAVAAVDKFSNNNHFTGLTGMNYGPNNSLFFGGGTNMNAINQINPAIDSNFNNMNFNINPYLLSTAAPPTATATTATATTTTTTTLPYRKDGKNNVNAAVATAAPIPNFNNNANNHAAILQQYATIMQQNDKGLQQLQKTSNFFTALNPVLIDSPTGAINKPISIVTASNSLMDTNNNIDVNTNVAGPAPILDQLKELSPPDQQKQSTQTIVIECAPSGNEPSQLQNRETINNTNNNIIDNNSKTANTLRTATMLQNGAPFLQPQFESSHIANRNNNNINSNSKINGNTSATSSSNNDNKAASILPMPTMNSNNLIPPTFSFPMIGGGSHNILNYQNTIMFGKNNNDNFYNAAAAAAVASANSGLISLQQQAFQQHGQAMISHLQQQQQQQQQIPPSQPASNDVDISPDQKQKQKHKPKRKLHLSRPLYLDHDSNCRFCFSLFTCIYILFDASKLYTVCCDITVFSTYFLIFQTYHFVFGRLLLSLCLLIIHSIHFSFFAFIFLNLSTDNEQQ